MGAIPNPRLRMASALRVGAVPLNFRPVSVDPPRPRVVQRCLPLGGGLTHMGEGQLKDSGAAAREILVVEDDREINELVCAYAQIAGYESRSALNGSDALEQVRRRAPALIVLDLMLPDVDGFEVCRRVRAEAEANGKPIPVI